MANLRVVKGPSGEDGAARRRAEWRAFEDRLARKTAAEEDRLARRRVREFIGTDEDALRGFSDTSKGMAAVVLVCFGLVGGLILALLH